MLDYGDAQTERTVSAQKIQKLVEWLVQHQFNAEEYKKVLAGLDLSRVDFLPYYRFSSDSYVRNTISCTENYELILICWEAGQISPVHNHGFSQCFVHCLEGSVHENSYLHGQGDMSFRATKKLIAGDSTVICDEAIYHEFGNASQNERAVTLHLYSPKILSHNIFDKESRGIHQRQF